jgi:spore germination protein YaaH
MNDNPRAVMTRRWVAGALALLVMLSLLLGSSIQAATAQTCSTQYKVQSGDTLSSIADKYGVTVQALAAANSLTDPYQIYVGQTLCIPAGATVVSTGTVSSTSASTTPGFSVTPSGMYVVTIKTNKMSKQTPYYVRLYSGNRRPLGMGTRLGTIKTDKNGNATRSYGIPSSFYDKNAQRWGKYATFCLKNPWNDAQSCQTIYMTP